MISEEELIRLGLPKNSLKVKDPATGKEGYRAAVEVFHQLHCLNLLRQAIYKDYYKNIYSDIQEEEHGLKGHVGKLKYLHRSCRHTDADFISQITASRPSEST